MFSIKTEPLDTGVREADYGGNEPHCGGPVSSFQESPLLGHMDGSSKKRAGARVSTKGIKRPGYRRRITTPFSYVELIRTAIKSSPNCMLTLREILTHLEENNECFQGSYVGWKNSVRHNLSVNDCFVKLLRDSTRPFGKDNFWVINPDHPQAGSCMKAPAKRSPTSPFDVRASYTPPQTGSPLPLSGADGETVRTSRKIDHPVMESEEPVDLRKCAEPVEENSSRGGRLSSPRPHDSHQISTPTVPCKGSSLSSGHTLPISRFLNSPPISRERDPDPTTSTTTDTRRSSRTPTSPRATSTVLEPISPPSTEDIVSREAVPHKPEEWKVLKGLYEHYWNRALHERHTLFCQHLAMLKDRHDKLEYQRSLSVCVPPAYPPVGYQARPLLLDNYMPYGYPPTHWQSKRK